MYRSGVVAFATARLIFACRVRRSAVRRTGPHTYDEHWEAQNIHGDHSCRGVRSDTPPVWDRTPDAPMAGSAGHLRPHKAGQLPSNGHHASACHLPLAEKERILSEEVLVRT